MQVEKNVYHSDTIDGLACVSFGSHTQAVWTRAGHFAGNYPRGFRVVYPSPFGGLVKTHGCDCVMDDMGDLVPVKFD